MMKMLRLAFPFFLAAGGMASGIPLAGTGTPALVGTSASFYGAGVCREVGCIYQGVRRTKLEGSGNPVLIYTYRLSGGQEVEVTRYNLPGQPGDKRIASIQYLRGDAGNMATPAARIASAAAGYPVTAAQVDACWRQLEASSANGYQSRTITSKGFNDPFVTCFKQNGLQGVTIGFTS